jgi:hypothetical protein
MTAPKTAVQAFLAARGLLPLQVTELGTCELWLLPDGRRKSLELHFANILPRERSVVCDLENVNLTCTVQPDRQPGHSMLAHTTHYDAHARGGPRGGRL